MLKILSAFLFILLFSAAQAADTATPHYIFASESDAKRFQQLTDEIRCVVCQNQTIADSTAPLANDLREKIFQLIADKASDESIKNYLVKRYGEFILLKPRFNPSTWLLWLFPCLALSGVIITLVCYNRPKSMEQVL